jgi:hypothetical protein
MGRFDGEIAMPAFLYLLFHVVGAILLCSVVARQFGRQPVFAAGLRLAMGVLVFAIVLHPLKLYPPAVTHYAPLGSLVYCVLRAAGWWLTLRVVTKGRVGFSRMAPLALAGVAADFLADLSLPMAVHWVEQELSKTVLI